MLKLILLLNILSSLLFGAVSELVNPGTNQIIDFGFNSKSKDNKLTVPKEWVDSATLAKKIDSIIITKSRDIFTFECERDYLGRQNCTEQAQDCNAQWQLDDGLSQRIYRTVVQNKVKKSVPRHLADNPNQIKGDSKLNPTVGAIDGSRFQLVYNSVNGGGRLPSPTALYDQGYQKNSKFAIKMFHYGSGCGGFSFSPVPDQITVLVDGGSSVRRVGYQGACSQLISSGNAQYAIVLAEWNNIPGSLTYQCDDFCLMGKPSDEDFGFWAWSCADTFIDADGIKASYGTCKKDYSYHKYYCDNSKNIYDKPWIGPVVNSGGDCNGNCGPYGCVCNSENPPKNNCMRETYFCPFDNSQLCTITTTEEPINNNVSNNFIYENGNAKLVTKELLEDKKCKNGVKWNKEKDICELDINGECEFGENFTLDKQLNLCMSKINSISDTCSSDDFSKSGYFINEFGIKELCKIEDYTSCKNGYMYNVEKGICEAEPVCNNNATYNKNSNKCELNITCKNEYLYNSISKECEKAFELIESEKETIEATKKDNEFTCPNNYINNQDGTCSLNTCLDGYILLPNDSSKCYKNESGEKNTDSKIWIDTPKCSAGTVLDKNINKCVSNPVCKEDGIINSNICESESFNKCEGNMFCGYRKPDVCESGSVYNEKTNKCEAEGFCEVGFMESDKGCVKEYFYSKYSCPAGFIGPMDPGIDCLGLCGPNGCSCNSASSPANNCKQEYKPSDNDFSVFKERSLKEYKVIGSVLPKEYGVHKNFECGDNCLFAIEKIVGNGDSLCFKKENTQEECIRVPGCIFTGEITDSVYPNHIYDLNLDDQYTLTLSGNRPNKTKITSSCKMNGHVGWHSREEGIVSIIKDPENSNRMLFWDSYVDKQLGFIEFVKEVYENDMKEGFIPEHNFLYEMLSQGFTASDAIDGNTLFVSSKPMEAKECDNLADKNKLFKASMVTQKTRELTKILSGNRFELEYKNPDCENGVYVSTINRCISDLKNENVICANGKYDRVSVPNETDILRKHAIWDHSQGDNITVYANFYIPENGTYEIAIGTLGTAQLFIDESLILYAQHHMGGKESFQNLYFAKGIYEVKIIARKDTLPDAVNGSIVSGSRGFAVSIKDYNKNTISSSDHWCKNTETVNSCPSDGFLKYGNVCLKTAKEYCLDGEYQSNGSCKLEPKCILSKIGEITFRDQTKAIKEEIRDSSKRIYQCSPLKCINGECKTAICPFDVNGKQYSGTIFPHYDSPSSGDCTNQTCDGNKPYYEYCGKPSGCDKSNPLVYEDSSGNCHQLYCPAGQIMDIERKVCKKLGCPDGTVPKGEACVQK